MALKDWKKHLDYNNIWKKQNNLIEILPNIDSRGNIKYYTVEIFLYETKYKNSKKIIKRFKTKSQALKFAKDYMRKH